MTAGTRPGSGLKTQVQSASWLSQPRCQDVIDQIGISIEHFSGIIFLEEKKKAVFNNCNWARTHLYGLLH